MTSQAISRHNRRVDRLPAPGWHEAVITGAYAGRNPSTGAEYLTVDAELRAGLPLRFSLTYKGTTSALIEDGMRVLVALADALGIPPRRNPTSLAAALTFASAPVLLDVTHVPGKQGRPPRAVVTDAQRVEAN